MRILCRIDLFISKFEINTSEAKAVIASLFPDDIQGQLHGVPGLPHDEQLNRDEAINACRELLSSSTCSPVAITAPPKDLSVVTGWRGWEIRASQLARGNVVVRKRFRDGIIWVDVGQAVAGDESKALRFLQSYVSRRLGIPFDAASISEGRDLLRRALADAIALSCSTTSGIQTSPLARLLGFLIPDSHNDPPSRHRQHPQCSRILA